MNNLSFSTKTFSKANKACYELTHFFTPLFRLLIISAFCTMQLTYAQSNQSTISAETPSNELNSEEVIYASVEDIMEENLFANTSFLQIMNNDINKGQVIDRIAQGADLSKSKATLALNTFTNLVENTLSNGGSVAIIGFGTFKVVHVPEKVKTNPQTGEQMRVPAHNAIKFAPSSQLSGAVR